MGEHRRRDREPELLGCLEVDHQLNLPWAEITGAAGTAGLFFIRPSRRAGKSGASRERRIPLVSSPSASCSAGNYNRAGVAACGYKAARPTTGGNGEGPKPTQLSRSRRLLRTAVVGHEDQFRPPSLSGCCRLGEETSAGMGGKEEDAPKAVAKGLADARVIVRPGLGVGGSRAMPNHSGGSREIFSFWAEPRHTALSRYTVRAQGARLATKQFWGG
jgi:hypothetical protein